MISVLAGAAVKSEGTRHFRLKHSKFMVRRLGCCVAASTLFFLTCISGSAIFVQHPDSEPAQNPPIKVEIVEPKQRVCPKSTIKVEVIVTNISDGDTAIDLNGLYYQTKFIATFELLKMRLSTADSGPHPKTKFVILKSKQTYKTSISFPLNDQFFDSLGVYKMSIGYGQFAKDNYQGVPAFNGGVTSNDISFEITPCDEAACR